MTTAILLAAALAAQVPGPPMSLGDAWRAAQGRDPDILAAEAKRRADREAATQARALSLPKVQAQGDIIEVRFHQAPFENWIFWLDAAVRETRTRIVDLSVTRESPGVFSGRLALEMARRGK